MLILVEKIWVRCCSFLWSLHTLHKSIDGYQNISKVAFTIADSFVAATNVEF